MFFLALQRSIQEEREVLREHGNVGVCESDEAEKDVQDEAQRKWPHLKQSVRQGGERGREEERERESESESCVLKAHLLGGLPAKRREFEKVGSADDLKKAGNDSHMKKRKKYGRSELVRRHKHLVRDDNQC